MFIDFRRPADKGSILFKNSSTREGGDTQLSLDITKVDQSILSGSQLSSVICQVRFDAAELASQTPAIRELRTRLGGHDAFRLEQFQENAFTFAMGPNIAPAAQSGPSTRGWRLHSKDGKRVIAVLPNAVTLEVFDYAGWDDYVTTFQAVVSAVSEVIAPVFEQRIGLRYVNQLTVPEDVREPGGWIGFIDPAVLSLATHPEIGPLVRLTRHQTVLELDADVRCNISDGFAPDDDRGGALTYVLDFDVFREGVRDFDPDEICSTVSAFNLVALRLFQLATTDELRQLLAS